MKIIRILGIIMVSLPTLVVGAIMVPLGVIGYLFESFINFSNYCREFTSC